MATAFPNSSAPFFPELSDTVYNLDFTAAGAKSVNVPAGAKAALISASGNNDVYVRANGAAAVPTADVTDGSGSEINPAGRSLNGVTTIGVAVNAACMVSLTFYF